MPYQLVATPIQPDLHAAVRDLVEGVDTGEITGLGVIVTTRHRRFFVDAFGSLTRDPFAPRGYIASLDDCLRDIGQRRRERSTTL